MEADPIPIPNHNPIYMGQYILAHICIHIYTYEVEADITTTATKVDIAPWKTAEPV